MASGRDHIRRPVHRPRGLPHRRGSPIGTPGGPNEGGADVSRPEPARLQLFVSKGWRPGACRRAGWCIEMRRHDKRRLWLNRRSGHSRSRLLARHADAPRETGRGCLGDGSMLLTRRVEAPYETGRGSSRDGIMEVSPRRFSPLAQGGTLKWGGQGSRSLTRAWPMPGP